MGVKRLFRRTKEVLKEGGIRELFLKIKFYLRDINFSQKRRLARNEANIFADVLFINGCYLPHPSRYRVTHQMEQLFANRVISKEVFYTELRLDYIKRFRVFIFYRCPYTDEIGEFIRVAKKFNKVVLFDIDDLVIDRKYTDQIPYVAAMCAEEKKNYDDGVARIQKTLRLCDAAITTTEALAKELKNYVPEVFINRNVASEEMCKCSEAAAYERDVLPFVSDDTLNGKQKKKKRRVLAERKKTEGFVKIGYFSGSITHNDDIEMILPILQQVMGEFPQVHLYFVGELDVPKELEIYRDRIHSFPFVDWKQLPSLIAKVDINIAPLTDSVFNAAKSENKWTEAALVKVPTIASRIGAMEHMIEDGKTGVLCSNEEEWLGAFRRLVTDESYRRALGEKAYDVVTHHCLTINSGVLLTEYIRKKMTPNIAFVLPSLQISGGILVILKHCTFLKQAGYDVLIINDNTESGNIVKDGEEINVLSTKMNLFHGQIDIAVGSLWTTMNWISGYQNIHKKAYLVQNYETDFYECGNYFRFGANQTYTLPNVRYITISKWCERWLCESFHRDVRFIPNGLERNMFLPEERKFDGEKIRILVEGNSDDHYKNVDESFRIVEMLDHTKYEIWFLSYQGVAKKWYCVDKFFHRVPYEKVSEIYRSCHILLKSSILESFSYPPLEMMATGGFVVVRPNEGNIEYLRDQENCLMYDPNDLQTAVDAIERIVSDPDLQKKLWEGGQSTADSRAWENFQKQIVEAYLK